MTNDRSAESMCVFVCVCSARATHFGSTRLTFLFPSSSYSFLWFLLFNWNELKHLREERMDVHDDEFKTIDSLLLLHNVSLSFDFDFFFLSICCLNSILPLSAALDGQFD